MAEKKGNTLVAIDPEAQEVLENLGSAPQHLKGDIFKAKPRPNVPEKDKPTPAQQRARQENIQKAQAARYSKVSPKAE